MKMLYHKQHIYVASHLKQKKKQNKIKHQKLKLNQILKFIFTLWNLFKLYFSILCYDKYGVLFFYFRYRGLVMLYIRIKIKYTYLLRQIKYYELLKLKL